ncbi:UNVERIFIED_CONTAM: hypothetical protein FKN15_047388 [Acipenser sinensis]
MGIDRRQRASLALTLNFIAVVFSVSALSTSYWCEGTRKVVKPFCKGPVKLRQSYCIMFNSSNINDSRLVQYIWETGDDKFLMRRFHTGIWLSCEENVNGIADNHIVDFSSPDLDLFNRIFSGLRANACRVYATTAHSTPLKSGLRSTPPCIRSR